MVENLCVIVLRETRPQWYKPGYKAPLYPILQVLGVVSGGFLLIAMGSISIIAFFTVSLPGLLFYIFYASKRTTRKGVIGIKSKRADLVEGNKFPQIHTDFYEIQREAKVVVGLFGKEKSPDMLVEMGVAIAGNEHVEVASILEVPEQTTLRDIMEPPAEIRSLKRRVRAMAENYDGQITFDSIVTHDFSKSIYEISQCVHCEWLFVEWRGKDRGALTIHNPIGWLKSHLECNLVIFRDAGVRYIKSILVLLNDDRNDSLVLETARHLAQINKAELTLIKWIDQRESR